MTPIQLFLVYAFLLVGVFSTSSIAQESGTTPQAYCSSIGKFYSHMVLKSGHTTYGQCTVGQTIPSLPGCFKTVVDLPPVGVAYCEDRTLERSDRISSSGRREWSRSSLRFSLRQYYDRWEGCSGAAGPTSLNYASVSQSADVVCVDTDPNPPPPPDPVCSQPAGTELGFQGFQDLGRSSGCVGNCSASATLAFEFASGGSTASRSVWVSTGQYCETSDGTADTSTCATIGSESACAVKDQPVVADEIYQDDPGTPENEGGYSGASYADLENSPEGCVLTQTGRALCIQGATSPPDDGFSQTPATPDGVVNHYNVLTGNGTQTYNYYSTTTVNNSSNYGSGGQGPGTGTGSNGDQDGDPQTLDGTSSNECQTVPSCSEGNSIECAILRQQWTDTCRVYDFSRTTAAAVRSAAGLNDNPGLSDADYVEAVLGDQVDLREMFNVPTIPGMATEACPAPMVVNVLGNSIEFDFEPICDFLRYIGLFVVISSTLLAFKIAFGRKN